jgi:quinoprotein glucose dehydrogenase
MHRILLFALAFGWHGFAAELPPAPSKTNSASSDFELAVKKLRLTPGFKAEIYAAEPLIQNPVSFTFDEQGRAYVVETHRRRTSVFDIRNHLNWLNDDYSFRTVEDRSNFFRKVLIPGNTNLPPKIMVDRNKDGKFDFHDLEVESERVRMLVDQNGDGVADKATTFADGFNTLVSGVAAGVLAHKGNVYLTCIPDLWLLRDTNNDGVADYRKSLATGFGVHISAGGHDLHGLKMGPDGKLYFTSGDRGFNVVSGDRKLISPDAGAVLRCNPDGTDLEIFATGLRNPQELAFDQFGNLWTGDNNADGGDKARWLYLAEGGEYGWQMGWQHLPKLGAWNLEGLWELPPNNTAAYLLPPVAHIGHGPAGIAFYPGTGMPAQYRNHFFMTDFPGGVHTFAVEPRGAGFDMFDLRQFVWELYPVDVDFGPDGGAYVLDWVEGWEKTGKGRLFRIFEEKSAKDPVVAQTRQLLAQGMEKRSPDELASLLGHVDMRVRQEAQFELASRGLRMTNVLASTIHTSPNDLARYHAIWALGQIARAEPLTCALLFPLVDNATNAEIRAQAAKVLGDSHFPLAEPYLGRAANDPNLRVRYFGLLGLGKIGATDAADTILEALRNNNDADPYIRHACVMALALLNDVSTLDAASKDQSPAVKLGALLAMRRLQKPEVAMFLYDSSPQLVLEAARAVYDLPINSAMTQLAALISKSTIPKGAMRRALHANYRLGKLENAMALSEFASNTNFLPELRADAIELLGRWAEAPKRDLFLGLWRPLPAREARAASITFRSEVPNLLQPGPAEVRLAGMQAAVRLGVDSISPELLQIFTNKHENADLRLEALHTLGIFKAPQLREALQSAATEENPEIRKEASVLQMKSRPADTVNVALRMLDTGILPEKQTALELLGNSPSPAVDPVLLMWVDRVGSGKAPKELYFEILEAAAKRKDPLIKSALQRVNETRSKDPLANHSECLAGGDPSAGKKIFLERADVQCIRCHQLNGTGGEVGPDLTGIGRRLSREDILESILLPNNKITKGYENLIIKMRKGETHVGLLRGEDPQNVIINSPEEGQLKLPKAAIEDLNLGLSAMPAEIASMLNKRDLRNLIEFLAEQK